MRVNKKNNEMMEKCENRGRYIDIWKLLAQVGGFELLNKQVKSSL